MTLEQENLLLAHIEGLTSPEEEAAVQAMIDQDPQLGRLLSQMKTDRMAVMTLPMAQAPEGLVDDILAGRERLMLLGDPIDAPHSAPAHRQHRLMRISGYMAAAAALAICGTVLFEVLSEKSDFSEQSQVAKNISGGNAPESPDAANNDNSVSSPSVANKVNDEAESPLRGNGLGTSAFTRPSQTGLASGTSAQDVSDAAGTTPRATNQGTVQVASVKPHLDHAVQARQLELVASSRNPQDAQAALRAWAFEQGLTLETGPASEDGSQTFMVAWRASANVSDLKNRLRDQGQAQLTHEAATPMALVSTDLPNSPTASLDDLVLPATAARGVGVAVAYAQDQPVLIDSPRFPNRFGDPAAFATGAETGLALGSATLPEPLPKWVANTPTIDTDLGPMIRVTIQSAAPKSLGETKKLPSFEHPMPH